MSIAWSRSARGVCHDGAAGDEAGSIGAVTGRRPRGSEPQVNEPSRQPGRSTIRSQDLVSVPVLRALLQERSVTRAADVVGLTQPAVSNALARLRRRFGDDLLVRIGREYQLTPLGQRLLDRSETVFDALERLFEQDFDPASSTRRFTLVQSDYTMVLLAAPLTRILRAEAPGVRLGFQHLTTAQGDFQEALRHADGVIVPPDSIRGHPHRTLLTDRWVCVVARDNPHVGATLTTADLATLPWVASYDQTVVSTPPPCGSCALSVSSPGSRCPWRASWPCRP